MKELPSFDITSPLTAFRDTPRQFHLFTSIFRIKERINQQTGGSLNVHHLLHRVRGLLVPGEVILTINGEDGAVYVDTRRNPLKAEDVFEPVGFRKDPDWVHQMGHYAPVMQSALHCMRRVIVRDENLAIPVVADHFYKLFLQISVGLGRRNASHFASTDTLAYLLGIARPSVSGEVKQLVGVLHTMPDMPIGIAYVESCGYHAYVMENV